MFGFPITLYTQHLPALREAVSSYHKKSFAAVYQDLTNSYFSQFNISASDVM